MSHFKPQKPWPSSSHLWPLPYHLIAECWSNPLAGLWHQNLTQTTSPIDALGKSRISQVQEMNCTNVDWTSENLMRTKIRGHILSVSQKLCNEKLGMQPHGRVLALHAWDPEFNPQNHWKIDTWTICCTCASYCLERTTIGGALASWRQHILHFNIPH